MNHSILNMNIMIKPKFHHRPMNRLTQTQNLKASTSLQNKRVSEFIRQNPIVKHNTIQRQCPSLRVTSLGKGSNESIE